MKKLLGLLLVLSLISTLALSCTKATTSTSPTGAKTSGPAGVESATTSRANDLLEEGQRVFRFETFGDEAFWGGTLQLHKAIVGSKMGGVGAGISPKQALALGFKVDWNALPPDLQTKLKNGQVNLDDPASTVALIRADSVLGVKGIFSAEGSMTSLGLSCAICHSTVDNSIQQGIGTRLDGWANHDLNVGAIIASAPNLKPALDLLKKAPANRNLTAAQAKSALMAWGPGKFDAELFLDGKTTNPTTGKPGATLIPNAFDMAGVNQHTWTGAWGTVTYWNAFVAVLELHGKGNFFDPRLDDSRKFPIAAAARMGHTVVPPDQDLVTKNLQALHFYQLALPAPKPKAGKDFDAAAAKRGNSLFGGKAKCQNCHKKPLWTEPGWNLHTPAEIGIESFQADRAPDGMYKTMTLRGLFIRENGVAMDQKNKGRFYHDGRFATLLDVINHYNTFMKLGLTAAEKDDLVEYLKSL